MKKFLIAMLVAVSSMSLIVPETEAKRMGSGGSIGRQSQAMPQSPAQSPIQQQNANQARPATPAATPQNIPPKPSSPWRNILGGALLGLGLGALLSHLGIGGALASVISTILMIALLALAVLFIMRLLRNKKAANAAPQPAFANGYASGPGYTPEVGSKLEPHAQPAAFQAEPPSTAYSPDAAPYARAGSFTQNIPADFDVPSFLRNAKTYFIRLQAAWDKADINDIREFTTPEMFGELRLQLQERGAAPNHTDVVSLEAELLGVETLETEYLASVKFTGMIKEAEHLPVQPFAEIWNLVKSRVGQGGWVLAGIQQVS